MICSFCFRVQDIQLSKNFYLSVVACITDPYPRCTVHVARTLKKPNQLQELRVSEWTKVDKKTLNKQTSPNSFVSEWTKVDKKTLNKPNQPQELCVSEWTKVDKKTLNKPNQLQRLCVSEWTKVGRKTVTAIFSFAAQMVVGSNGALDINPFGKSFDLMLTTSASVLDHIKFMIDIFTRKTGAVG